VIAGVTLREFERSHLPLLAAWLRRPHVARWYRAPDENLAWAADPPAGGSQAIIAQDGAPIGYMRWQRVDREVLDRLGLQEIPAGSVDVDLLIGEEAQVGRGIGPQALADLVKVLRRDPTVPLAGLTSSIDNTSAHRAFQRAGFRILRQYAPAGFGICHLMICNLRQD
jgi:RimJ/RimL family protein N-acetyltransferase